MATTDDLPRWAVLPAARKLIIESLRHPNSGKVVVVDRDARTVEVRSSSEPVGGSAAASARTKSL